MAGVVGFEPTHGGTKNRCLTAWLHPTMVCSGHMCYEHTEFATGMQGFFRWLSFPKAKDSVIFLSQWLCRHARVSRQKRIFLHLIISDY